MSTVVERDIVEDDIAASHLDGCRIGNICDADRFVMDGNQFLHVVDRALQMVDVHAYVREIAVNHEIAGQDVGHIARRCAPGCPEQ